ncbi:MAG TPA: alkaline phosphatase family protein [Gemmataceae bacterium]|nr:alkaline phosphatase family protein [Gemmataceae bacterium]
MRSALAALVALVASVGTLTASTTPRPASSAVPDQDGKPRVKLAVLVVFDQMRGDYLEKWKPLFAKGGFARLQDEGAWFVNCHYPYAITTTGPGHASILSGTCPDRHGIINNEWSEKGRSVYCAGDERYQLVPAPLVVKPGAKPKPIGTPERLLAETLADVLKRAHGAKAKVFGLSLKDRSAILPIGKRPDGAYWFDGRFVTSTYYAEAVHPWVAEFNRSGAAERWFGKEWTRFRPDLDYEKYSGPDDVVGEGRRVTAKDTESPVFGRTFPHPLGAGDEKAGPKYYEGLACSPHGNDLLLELTKACVIAEDLGKDDVPDLLVVSFSSNDLIGHIWGPDSQEVLDVTLRSDALMAELLGFLDEKVGKGNYALAVTADHGICPLPEVSAGKGLDAKRIDPKAFQAGIENHLKMTFGPACDAGADDEPKAASGWVEAFAAPWIYINPRLAKAAGKTPAEVARTLADYLAKQPEVFRVFTREDLAAEFPEGDPVGRRVKRSFHPDRSGDVYVVLRPYYLLSSPLAPGTNHGTPHDYDTYVPLLVYGPGVSGGRRDESVTPQATAAVFARFLGLRPPSSAEFPVPATLETQ